MINLRRGGKGPPLLLLHGYPETHAMWHKLAPTLAERFTVICPDLRGYGDSSKPPGGAGHYGYSKRAMAADQIEVMEKLGFRRFQVVGHDRGARITHRMCLDHPERVERAAVLDIIPTADVFARTDKALATYYYHWFFLIQPFDLPERLIGGAVDHFLERSLRSWSRKEGVFAEEVMAEYRRCFRDPATIHATCEDYRAGASVDLVHDAADAGKKVECPLLVLWGANGVVGRLYDPITIWREKAVDVQGQALPCGHFLPEEAPAETLASLSSFLHR
ncbi:MAG TPA: alpha/beta hydrolase [Stellaceae bacterium]